uniref:Uncharacterized protein n=1 Tax=Lates calcarifer TaxID=8187 RepID=A0A4W6C1F8_LATCA
GLLRFFSEDTSRIIKMCDVRKCIYTLLRYLYWILWCVLHDAFPLEIFNMAVVVEETIVLHDIRNVPTGFAMLMGTIYCLNLESPHAMKYSFEFLQRVVMKIKSHQCSARIHGLRNKLLRYRL